jgi:hypothetical protein
LRGIHGIPQCWNPSRESGLITALSLIYFHYFVVDFQQDFLDFRTSRTSWTSTGLPAGLDFLDFLDFQDWTSND